MEEKNEKLPFCLISQMENMCLKDLNWVRVCYPAIIVLGFYFGLESDKN